MPTFNPGDAVPPLALVSSSDDVNADAIGTDITPVGWPARSKARAVEVELSVTSELSADGDVRVAVSTPGALDPITGFSDDDGGDWSGADGVIAPWGGGATIDAYYLNKFGSWRTEYLQCTPGPSSGNALTSTTTETPGGTGWDVRVRVRSSDWSTATGTFCDINQGFGLHEFQFSVSSSLSTIGFRSLNPDENNDAAWTVDQADFSLTDDEWVWLRVAYNGSTRTMYQSSNGTSWTTVESGAFTGWKTGAPTDPILIGRGNPGVVWTGDLSDFVVYDGNGALIHDLALDAQDASDDSAWSSAVSNLSRPDSSDRPESIGAVEDSTVRVRLDFDGRPRTDQWRLIIRCDSGEVTVDEILLEAGNYGWKVGSL